MDKIKDLQIYRDFFRSPRFFHNSIAKRKVAQSRFIKLSVPATDAPYLMTGKALFNSEEFQKSLFPLKKATIINPKNTVAQICLANLLLKLGKEIECFLTIKKALSISPKESALHSWIIKILKEKNRLDDLPSFYQETAKMASNDIIVLDLYLHSAEILENLKMLPQALRQYRKASETGTMRSQHYIQYANALVRQGLLEQAIVQFEHAWKLEPSSTVAINEIASLHYELGRVDEAFELLEDIIDNCLETNMTYLNLMLVLECIDKDEEVIKKYRYRAQRYIQRNTEGMQIECRIELMRIERKFDSCIDEHSRELYRKKLQALKTISILIDNP